MKKIFDFELFLESIASGKSVYYYSERFRRIIDKIASEKDPVAMFIKQAEGWEEFQDDITFIDLGETEDKVSFIQVNRLDRLRLSDMGIKLATRLSHSQSGETVRNATPIKDLSEYIEKVWRLTQSNLSHDSWTQQRTQIGVGRFVNRVAALQKITVKSEQLEKFVNIYKAYCKKIIGKENFELVDGEIIKTYYSVNSYQEKKGQLFASCMRYDECQTFFNIYAVNLCFIFLVYHRN